MTSLVGGIKGERDVCVCVCDLAQPRVDNVATRWPQNSLNLSVRIRRFSSARERHPDLGGWQAGGGGGRHEPP